LACGLGYSIRATKNQQKTTTKNPPHNTPQHPYNTYFSVACLVNALDTLNASKPSKKSLKSSLNPL